MTLRSFQKEMKKITSNGNASHCQIAKAKEMNGYAFKLCVNILDVKYKKKKSETDCKTWIMKACRLEMTQCIFYNKGP